MYMLVRWLRINARMVCSSVALMSFAKLTTGMVAVMPWLPLPLLLITATGAPPMRASQAAEV